MTRDRRADAEAVILREAVVDERAVGAELAEDVLRALDPVERDHLARVRVDGGDELGRAEDARLAGAGARDRLDAWRLRGRLGGVDRDRREVVLRRDRVVGGEDLVDGAAERARDPGRKRRHERDERQADHQRRRGRGGPLRVAPCVVAREPSRRAAEPCGRRAERCRERPDEPGGEERDADEDQQRADAHPEQDLRRPETAAEEPVEQGGEAEAGRQERAERCGNGRSATAAASPPRGRRRSVARASRGWRDAGSRAASR